MSFVPVLVWILTGLLLVLLVTCIVAGRGGLRRNHYFGVRLPALMRSDDGWRAGHAAAIIPASVAFAVALACSLIGFVVPVVHLGTLVAFIGGVIWAGVTASRAAQARTR